MIDEMIEFTPEYFANCRKAKGGPWVFSDTRQALAEIERLQFDNSALVKEIKSLNTRIFNQSDIIQKLWGRHPEERPRDMLEEQNEFDDCDYLGEK